MSWAKRNLYFLISCILAVGLLAAAGWFCYSSWTSNSANWEQLNAAYTQLGNIAGKNPGAGNDLVNNIEAARDETKEVKARVTEMEKLFTPVRNIPNTNRFSDRVMAGAVRDTVTQLRVAAAQHNVTLPPDFAFSFSLQVGKAVYEANSWDQLSKQLGEIKTLCDTLYACRIISLDSLQREHTADDVNPNQSASQPDYLDIVSVTNNNNMVITPYQVTFQCFTPELGNVLSSFANQQHTIVVKTVNIQPVELTSVQDMAMMQQSGAVSAATRAGGLPVVIDEKKLKVILLLDFVKILPAQGR